MCGPGMIAALEPGAGFAEKAQKAAAVGPATETGIIA